MINATYAVKPGRVGCCRQAVANPEALKRGDIIIPVIIRCDAEKARAYKKQLKRYGVKWTGADCFVGNIRPHKYGQVVKYCRENHLNISANNHFGERDRHYRENFFRVNPPLIGNIYLCAYCGMPRTRRRITVDHLYPVAYAKKSISFQKKARRKGMKSINDVRNLVAACSKCNSRKGAKMGRWIIRGKFGRHQHLWVIRHICRILLIAFLVWCFAKYGIEGMLEEIMKAGKSFLA